MKKLQMIAYAALGWALLIALSTLLVSQFIVGPILMQLHTSLR
jgi:hypothetical protein